jgi:DnaJ-class molecular chaperone
MPRELDYYALLGVARDATEADIREHFRVLARSAHPDRAPREKKAEAEAHFQDLTEAVNVLTNAQRRKAYDSERSLFAASGGVTSGDDVYQNYLNQGIQAFQAKQYAEAAGNFQLAVHRNDHDAKAQHYLGLASAKNGDLRTAVTALEAAMKLDPQNGRIYKDAGSVMKQAGLLLKAEKAYQEALRWDPGSAEVRKALDEVRAQRVAKA